MVWCVVGAPGWSLKQYQGGQVLLFLCPRVGPVSGHAEETSECVLLRAESSFWNRKCCWRTKVAQFSKTHCETEEQCVMH